MPFTWPLALAIYGTIWWIVLFAVLPLDVRSPEEAGEPAPDGADPGAPIAPHLARKAVITTIVATVVFAIVVAVAPYVTF